MAGFAGGVGIAMVAAMCALAGCLGREPGQSDVGTEKQHTDQVNPVERKAVQEVATFAGGCFWCMEAVFQDLKGVVSVRSGYTGGHTPNPTYEQVCTGDTGHAESVEITFDPKVIGYRDLLRVFFTLHDPTTLNRQGPDVGTQYRSAIFYHSDDQKRTSEEVIREVTRQHLWPAPIVTEVTKAGPFYPSEDYHRDYFRRNLQQPYCQLVIAPKVAKLREKYRALLRR